MKKTIEIIILLVMLVGVIILMTIKYQNKQTIQCEVKEKWIKDVGNGQKYNVKCDNTIYEISDLLFIGKFNSSDLYGELEAGKKYQIETTGYRIPFFSEYQNINKIEKVEE